MDEQSRRPNLRTDTWATVDSQHSVPTALVLSEDLVSTMGKLTSRRCKSALPFAGKYRLIDFALSNCVNSGIESVGVVTQYQPRSLYTHLAYGRPWGLDRSEGGLALLHPYQVRAGMDWYSGTVDAIRQNLDFVSQSRAGEVFALSGSEVYSMDLNVMVAQHRKTGADLTIASVAVDGRTTGQHRMLIVDEDGRVQAVIASEAPGPSRAAMMGIMLFNAAVLRKRVIEDAERRDSTHDLVRDLVPWMLSCGDRVMAFQYAGTWSAVHTVFDYWQAHMDLLAEHPTLNLQDAAWPIRTQLETRPPTRLASGARVSHSLLSEGCTVDGIVEYSVLSPGVYVAPGAVVRRSVVMHDATIDERAYVESAILDTEVIVGPQARVGKAYRRAPTSQLSMPEQLTVVEQGTHIPAQEVVLPDAVAAGWIMPSTHRDVSSARIGAD